MKTYKMTVKAICYCDVIVEAESEEEAEELAWDSADFGDAYDIDCLNVWGTEIGKG